MTPTPAQIETAELLRDLKRPAELIAINAGLPIESVRAWLRTGRWPKSPSTQRELFDAGATPREATKASVLTFFSSTHSE